MGRLTGKLVRSTEDGKEFACRESNNRDYPDDTLVLQAVDTEYFYTRDKLVGMVEDGKLEVVRDLHNKDYPFERRKIDSIHNA